MTNIYVRLSYDPTGRNPDNLIGSEQHDLKSISGFPYKIITMENGGFYARSLRVYDANYVKLNLNVDYTVTYRHAQASANTGLTICSDIVFLNKARTGKIFLTAQMVGGDIAFSLTAVADYIAWYKTKPTNYIPTENDFDGNEPIWKPGELDKERWALDTYEPFNNEIYSFARATQGETGTYEQNFRDKVKKTYDDFLDGFNNQLDSHIRNLNNPHGDSKATIGLGNVQDYALASDAIARAGTANDVYMTPLLTWATIDQFAVTPLNAHKGNTSNPHRTTPAMLGAPSKASVDASANSKYFTTETVADANTFTADGVYFHTWSAYRTLARRDIPVGAFLVGGSNGYINPRRMGRGTPTSETVLRSEGNWATWASIIAEKGSVAAPQVKVFSLGGVPANTYATQAQAHAEVINDAWSKTAPIGSIAFYKNAVKYLWGNGNGAWTTSHTHVNASYKSAGGWIQL